MLGSEDGNLLLDFTEALLVGKGNGVKVLGAFLDQLCINPGGEKNMGLVVFPECARPVVQLAVKRLLDKDLLEDLLGEVGRVLVPGGRFLFTDAGVMMGAISDEEALRRSLHAQVQFHPPGFNESLLEAAGLRLIATEDRTSSLMKLAESRRVARLAHQAELEKLEGAEFELHQRYLETVHEISRRGAVSRVMYLTEKA